MWSPRPNFTSVTPPRGHSHLEGREKFYSPRQKLLECQELGSEQEPGVGNGRPLLVEPGVGPELLSRVPSPADALDHPEGPRGAGSVGLSREAGSTGGEGHVGSSEERGGVGGGPGGLGALGAAPGPPGPCPPWPRALACSAEHLPPAPPLGFPLVQTEGNPIPTRQTARQPDTHTDLNIC